MSVHGERTLGRGFGEDGRPDVRQRRPVADLWRLWGVVVVVVIALWRRRCPPPQREVLAEDGSAALREEDVDRCAVVGDGPRAVVGVDGPLEVARDERLAAKPHRERRRPELNFNVFRRHLRLGAFDVDSQEHLAGVLGPRVPAALAVDVDGRQRARVGEARPSVRLGVRHSRVRILAAAHVARVEAAEVLDDAAAAAAPRSPAAVVLSKKCARRSPICDAAPSSF
mmetsp:Transcript_4743/g.19330  ORF Transcript_4743/g.19330 Transcript_4743/m.19330 type:complete len:226 (-) Transcript_4743:137-814(-)